MTPLLLLAAAFTVGPGADTWSGFRNDGGSRTTAHKLPKTWSPTENLAWRIATPGYGQSAPVVWKNVVYVTSVEGDQKEKLHLSAFAASDGSKLWQKTFASMQKGKNTPMMSRAAGTPVVDAKGVYALYESGDLFALTHDGEPRWERHFAKDFGELKNNHGLGSSLAQTDDGIVVLLDHQGPSHLLMVRKSDGQDRWKAARSPRSSWTSPILAEVGGRAVVIVSSSGSVTTYDANEGKLLWELTGLVGNNIPSPTAFGELIIVAAGENRMKPDLDASSKSNCCLKLIPTTSAGYEVVWQAKKLTTGTASPLVHAGHVYFTDKNGFVICIDLKTGEERYRERLENQQWATPIGAGDCVYFFGKDGATTVLKTGPVFEKLATNRLWSAVDFEARKAAEKKTVPEAPMGKTGPGGGPPLPKEESDSLRYSAVGDVVYGVAAVDGTFFLRTGTELICVRAK